MEETEDEINKLLAKVEAYYDSPNTRTFRCVVCRKLVIKCFTNEELEINTGESRKRYMYSKRNYISVGSVDYPGYKRLHCDNCIVQCKQCNVWLSRFTELWHPYVCKAKPEENWKSRPAITWNEVTTCLLDPYANEVECIVNASYVTTGRLEDYSCMICHTTVNNIQEDACYYYLFTVRALYLVLQDDSPQKNEISAQYSIGRVHWCLECMNNILNRNYTECPTRVVLSAEEIRRIRMNAVGKPNVSK